MTDNDHNSHSPINPNTLPNFATMPNVATMDTSHVNKEQPPFILVDGSYYLFRTYHALPKTMQNSQGLVTNAIRGTLNALLKLMRRYHPTHMAVCFDTKSPTFRHAMSEEYKANRPKMDVELAEQIPYIHSLVVALGIPLLRIEGAEADDIIGTLAHRAVAEGHHVVISTGDKDMMQLINDCVILEDSFTGKVTDSAGVVEKFGINPEQMIDFLTLMGDSSDGIKGVPGIGKKTAKDLLNEYGNIDNMLKNVANIKGRAGKNLVEYADDIPFNAQLATIVTDLEIGQDWRDLKINTDPCAHIDELRALYSELEFRNELASLDHPNHPANANGNGAQSVADSQADAESQAQIAKSLQSSVIDNIKDSKSHDKAWHTVLDAPAFDSLVTLLESAPHFVIDTETTSVYWRQAELVGLSFAVKAHEAYYVPLAHLEGDELITKQLDRDMVLTRLKPILENPNIGKIGQHLKYDAHILSFYDIDLLGSIHDKPNNWAMDTMLASYVINAAATRHGMDDLARHYLHTQTISFEDVAGKGAKQVCFDQVTIDLASDYACEDADITYQLFDLFSEKLAADKNNAKLLHELEIPTAEILCQMEANGILIKRPFLNELSQRFDEEIIALEKRAYEVAGEAFNLGSPKQLGEMLFEKLGVAGGKKTKSGQYSTGEAVLSKIDHPLVEIVLEYRGLSKLKSTYTDALDNVADAKTDRVHTSYHQALTSTGRLSSTDPNLQNIPIRTATGRLIRQAFIAPEGRVILAADYSQIELRLMAHFSGDVNLTRAFNEGLDIHTATAAEVLGKAVEEVSATERRNAKAINFGLLYGMSAFGLAKQLQMSRGEAQDYIDMYFERYPSVKDYMINTRASAYEKGYVETILGRKLYTPDINHSNRMVKQGAERAAINAPLQGSAADLIKLAMIAVDKVLPKEHAKMLLQVHDELVFEVDSDKVDSIRQLITDAMQDVLTTTAVAKGWHVNFAVPLLVETDIGSNWDEAH
ncbi:MULTISPECIES: DNA polymerase I [Psychrobacter]|uniref:DNA polymerase I n=1 Tax=Psychrobacter faecalis TaxID=180588 RepID=A0ABT9HET9_9GAMM|nr:MULTISPECIES: DNA polymerase I [Psychrobacter]MDP4543959.1 DNA polymerase I [Psychrobacter faecalis]OAP72091.1 DNA polymerase I [Psychrobacter sp. SHUES1]PKG86827.1 DNA polymerase I [Psychrobacter sp. Sarcosine-02u-2]WLW66817.1 DNA polymerase I [Psychrobacter sp. van23A]HCR87042.1 DNA polymerase I [Psychrobacter sp.]